MFGNNVAQVSDISISINCSRAYREDSETSSRLSSQLSGGVLIARKESPLHQERIMFCHPRKRHVLAIGLCLSPSPSPPMSPTAHWRFTPLLTIRPILFTA